MDDQKQQAPPAQSSGEHEALSTSGTQRPSLSSSGVTQPAMALTVTSEDGSKTVAVRSKFEVAAKTLVDLVALGILGAVLLLGRVTSEWLQAACVFGILLLAGARVADALAVAKGLPSRGGSVAMLVGGVGGLMAWLAARGGDS